MIVVRKIDSIKAAKRWFSMFVPHHSYQSYSVLAAIEHVAKLRFLLGLIKSPFRNVRTRPLFRVYVATDNNGTPLVLAPVQIVGDIYHIAGFSSNIDYDDILWGGAEKSVLKDGFHKILDRMKVDGAKCLQWEHLDPTSFTNEVIAAYGIASVGAVESVKIDIDAAGYGNNFCGLSKHARQNIRTAYNRLSRAGYEVDFKFYSNLGIGHMFPSKGIDVYRRVYKIRQEMRYGHHAGLKDSFVLKYCNYTTASVPGDSGFLAALHIKNDVAAYMEGYINISGGALEIPRLAIGVDYEFYSPGLILISECAKFLLQNTSLRLIDLCRGTEQYKFAAGGRAYNTYKKIIRL